jgi:tetratricopeptide (TPR) repeat protein
MNWSCHFVFVIVFAKFHLVPHLTEIIPIRLFNREGIPFASRFAHSTHDFCLREVHALHPSKNVPRDMLVHAPIAFAKPGQHVPGKIPVSLPIAALQFDASTDSSQPPSKSFEDEVLRPESNAKHSEFRKEQHVTSSTRFNTTAPSLHATTILATTMKPLQETGKLVTVPSDQFYPSDVAHHLAGKFIPQTGDYATAGKGTVRSEHVLNDLINSRRKVTSRYYVPVSGNSEFFKPVTYNPLFELSAQDEIVDPRLQEDLYETISKAIDAANKKHFDDMTLPSAVADPNASGSENESSEVSVQRKPSLISEFRQRSRRQTLFRDASQDVGAKADKSVQFSEIQEYTELLGADRPEDDEVPLDASEREQQIFAALATGTKIIDRSFEDTMDEIKKQRQLVRDTYARMKTRPQFHDKPLEPADPVPDAAPKSPTSVPKVPKKTAHLTPQQRGAQRQLNKTQLNSSSKLATTRRGDHSNNSSNSSSLSPSHQTSTRASIVKSRASMAGTLSPTKKPGARGKSPAPTPTAPQAPAISEAAHESDVEPTISEAAAPATLPVAVPDDVQLAVTEIPYIETDSTLRPRVLKSIDVLRRELNADDTFVDLKVKIRQNLVALLRHAGKFEEALGLISTLGDSKISQAESYWQRHLIYLIYSKTDLALKDLNTIAAIHRIAKAYKARAAIFFEMKHYDDAILNLQIALTMHPNDYHAYFQRALCYFEQGETLLGVQDLESVLSFNRSHIDSLLMLAKHYASVSRHDKAVRCYDDMISALPRSVEAYCLRGQCFEALHQYRNALVDYSQAIHLDPNNSSVLARRGAILRHIHPRRCINDLSLSILLDSSTVNVSAYLHRGLAYIGLKMFEQARSDFAAILAIETRAGLKTRWSAISSCQLGLISFHQDKDYNAARSSFTRALQADPTYVRAIVCRAQCHYALYRESKNNSHLNTAIREYSRIIHLHPNSPQIYVQRGR